MVPCCVSMVPDCPAASPIVLVVEDDAVVRMMARDLLEDASFEVLEAVSADEALRLLEERSDIEVLFIDVDMPGSRNGFEFASLVAERWPRIRLVITFGRCEPRDEDVPDAGQFLPKPYRLSGIVRAIRQAG